jgi:uncharacterized protein YeaO (DUF488 family)
MEISLKRIYDAVDSEDGLRILVDRLWPRGVTKQDAAVAVWAKNVAPSDELRKWFHKDTTQWREFKKRYHAELDANASHVDDLAKLISLNKVTLLYGSKDEKKNHAIVLRDYLAKKIEAMEKETAALRK